MIKYDLKSNSLPRLSRAPESSEIEKSKAFNLADVGQFVSEGLTVNTILKEATGDIRLASLTAHFIWAEKITPCDIFFQIIDGNAEVTIGEKIHSLLVGQAIIVPAHSGYSIRTNHSCKMLVTIIKSGYEKVIA